MVAPEREGADLKLRARTVMAEQVKGRTGRQALQHDLENRLQIDR